MDFEDRRGESKQKPIKLCLLEITFGKIKISVRKFTFESIVTYENIHEIYLYIYLHIPTCICIVIIGRFDGTDIIR